MIAPHPGTSLATLLIWNAAGTLELWVLLQILTTEAQRLFRSSP